MWPSSLAATQSASQILADAIGGHLPKWVWSAAIHLPTQTFKIIRRAQHLAILLGTRVIQEKRAAAHKGLDIATDLFGQLREYLHRVRSSHFFNALHSGAN